MLPIYYVKRKRTVKRTKLSSGFFRNLFKFILLFIFILSELKSNEVGLTWLKNNSFSVDWKSVFKKHGRFNWLRPLHYVHDIFFSINISHYTKNNIFIWNVINQNVNALFCVTKHTQLQNVYSTSLNYTQQQLCSRTSIMCHRWTWKSMKIFY